MCNCSYCQNGGAQSWDGYYGVGSGSVLPGSSGIGGTALPVGTCLLHGFHGMTACPSCSTATKSSVFEITVHKTLPSAPLAPLPFYYLVHDGFALVTVERLAALEELAADLKEIGDEMLALALDAQMLPD